MGRIQELLREGTQLVRVFRESRPTPAIRGFSFGPHKRVLVVEDDDVIVELLENICERIDPSIEVDGTPSGEVAEALLRNDSIYDLVLLDVNLRDRRTGIDVWRACHLELPGVRFVFLSAMPEHEFRRLTGACELPPVYIAKPCSLLKLTTELDAALRGQPQRQAA